MNKIKIHIIDSLGDPSDILEIPQTSWNASTTLAVVSSLGTEILFNKLYFAWRNFLPENLLRFQVAWQGSKLAQTDRLMLSTTRSSNDTKSMYPIHIHDMQQQWTDAALVFSAEITLLPVDESLSPTEFFLDADGFDSLCYVTATELAPGDLIPSRAQLPKTLPPKKDYNVTWVSMTWRLEPCIHTSRVGMTSTFDKLMLGSCTHDLYIETTPVLSDRVSVATQRFVEW